MKRFGGIPSIRKAAVAILLAIMLTATTGCPATVAAGQDPVLVHAQQIYLTARDTCDLVFSIEDANQAILEGYVRGFHAGIEKGRTTAKTWLPELKKQIDLYRKAQVHDLTLALAMVEQLLIDMQAALVKATTALGTKVGELHSQDWSDAEEVWGEMQRTRAWGG